MIEGEPQFLGSRGDHQRHLFLPPVLGNIDLVEDRYLRVLLQPFVEPTSLVNRAGTDQKGHLLPGPRLEHLQQIFHPLLGTLRSPRAVIGQKVGPLQPHDLVRPEEPDGLQRLDGPCTHLVGLLRVGHDPLHHVIGEFFGLAPGLEVIEEGQGFLGDPAVIRPNHCMDRPRHAPCLDPPPPTSKPAQEIRKE